MTKAKNLVLHARPIETYLDSRRVAPEVLRQLPCEAEEEPTPKHGKASRTGRYGLRGPGAGSPEARRMLAIYERTGLWVRRKS